MTRPRRSLAAILNEPLPILDSIDPTPDIGTEMVRHVWYRRIDRPRSGHLGWVRCELRCPIVLDWIAVRRPVPGMLVLKFAGQRSGTFGYRYFSVPVDEAVHRQFEVEVFAHLGLVSPASPSWPTPANGHARRRPPPHGGAP